MNRDEGGVEGAVAVLVEVGGPAPVLGGHRGRARLAVVAAVLLKQGLVEPGGFGDDGIDDAFEIVAGRAGIGSATRGSGTLNEVTPRV